MNNSNSNRSHRFILIGLMFLITLCGMNLVIADFLPEIPNAFAGLTDDPELDDFVELPDYVPRFSNSMGHFCSN
jgi:hypothetical protein